MCTFEYLEYCFSHLGNINSCCLIMRITLLCIQSFCTKINTSWLFTEIKLLLNFTAWINGWKQKRKSWFSTSFSFSSSSNANLIQNKENVVFSPILTKLTCPYDPATFNLTTLIWKLQKKHLWDMLWHFYRGKMSPDSWRNK